MKRLSNNLLRSLILEEIRILNECGCRSEVEDLRSLIPAFSSADYETHPNITMITDYELEREGNALDAKCPGSYAKSADQLVVNPEFIASIIKIIMDESGSTCPNSSAKALTDIIGMYNF